MKKILHLLTICMLCWSFAKADNEPGNNLPGTTTDVLPLNGLQTGTIGGSDNSDYYKLATNADGNITITIKNTDNSYYYIFLYDTDGITQLGTTQGNAAGTGITFTANGLAAGNYFIQVYSTQPTSAYTLLNTLAVQTLANDAEPNDVVAQATTISPNGTKIGHIGYRLNGGGTDNYDYYKLVTTTDGDITINFHNDINTYQYIFLYDNDGTTQLGTTQGNAQAGITFTTGGLAAGTYYIAVYSQNSNNYAGYTLSNTVTAAATPDAEPNDLPAQAVTIAQNGSKTGHTGYRYNGGADDAIDYYKLVTTMDGNITVNFQNDNNHYAYIFLWDNDGTTQLGTTQGNAQSGISFTVNGLAAGTYYISVQAANASNYSVYTLSNTVAPTPTAFNDAEPNNLFSHALTINPNDSVKGHIGYRYNGGGIDNYDYYKLVTTTDGDISLNLKNDNNAYNYFFLYDKDTTSQLGTSQGNAGGSGINFTVNALAAGTYYIAVYTPNNPNYSGYTLTANVPSTQAAFNDVEPNNLFSQAGTINPNDSVKGHVGYRLNGGGVDNYDYYKLVTTTDGNINVSLNNDNNGYTYVFLYDKDTTIQLGTTQGNAQPGIFFTTNALAAGTYYIAVYTPNQPNFSAYTLKNSITPAAYTNDVESNDDFTTATTLNNDSAKSGHVGYRFNGGAIDNTDYRKVIMYTAGSMSIDVTMANTNYSYVYLYDAAHNVIFSNQGNNALYSINFPNLAAGNYYLYVYVPNQPNFNSYKITKFVVPCNTDPSVITAGTTTTFCQGGSVVLAATANYPGYLWSPGNQTTKSITVNASGNYTLTATDYDGCATHVSNTIQVTVNPLPVTPTASTTVQPTCGVATGTIVVTSPTGAGVTYSIGAAYQASATFTGVGAGTYQVTAKSASGCISAATSVTVNQQPPTPATPTASVTVQPTCAVATGTIVVTAPTGTGIMYSIGGTYQASGTFTGVAAGTYLVTAQNSSTCISGSTSVTVNPQPVTPANPTASVTVQPPCSVTTGTITVTAPTGAGITYSIGGNYQASGTFAGVAPGTYQVTAQNSAGCISGTTAVTVNAAPGSPAKPTASVTVQPTCIVTTGTIVVSAPTGAGITYSIGGAYQASASFTGVTAGTYQVTAQNTGGCISGSTPVTVNPAPGAPANPTASVTVQPTCAVSTGTIVVTAPTGAGITYSIGGTYQSSGTFTAVAAGIYQVTAQNASGCISGSTSITVNQQPAAPANPTASVTAQPTCSVTTGTITITAPTGAGITYSIGGAYQAGTTFTGVAAGSYTVTAQNGGCISGSTAVTVAPAPGAPANPTASVTVQPTCSVGTGTIVVTAPTAAGITYSIGGTYQASGSFTGVTPGTYSVTAQNSAGCISGSTSVTVNPAPGAPANPAASVTIQPSCSIASGTIVVTAPTGAGITYSIGGTYQASGTFAGVAPGTYAVTAQNNGCISGLTSVTVNPQPASPSTPTAGVTVQPTCSVATGTIVVTAPTGAGITYSIGGAYQSGTTFTGVSAGTYSVTAKNSNGCVSGSATVTVNPSAGAPASPTVTVTVQPTCSVAIGTIVITAPTGAGITYSIGGTYQASGTFTGVAPGTYAVTAQNNGCTSGIISVTVNPQPAAPANPTASVTVQPTCSVATGTIVVTAPTGAGITYSIGGAYQASGTFTGVAVGTYPVTAQSGGCISGTASVTVNPQPAAPGNPTASVTVQPSCAIPTGTIVVTAPTGAGITYSIGGAYQASGTFTGISAGTYQVTVKNSGGCVSGSKPVTVNPQPTSCGGTYCTAGGTNMSRGFIRNVYLRNIFNTTGWDGGYGNFLNQSTTLTRGSGYVISATPGYSSFRFLSAMYTRVWIDWNHDGDFNDAGETVFAPGGSSIFPRIGVMSVPANALAGPTRMRVAMREDAVPSSCGSFTYGEVEDYTIIVSGAAQRSSAPDITEATRPSELFNIFPNPVSEEMVIQRLSNDHNLTVDANTAMQVTDINGRVVLHAMLKRPTEVIDVRRLTPGVYFVQLKTANAVSTKKIIIAH